MNISNWGRDKVIYAVLCLVALVAIGSTIFITSSKASDKPFTELYFVQPTSLPDTFSSNSDYNFSFIINNKENEHVEYKYQITAEANGDKKTIKEDTVSLDSGKSIEISNKISLDVQSDTKITVNLTNKGQFISFWIRT
jgi:uncharacterized membrane protein